MDKIRAYVGLENPDEQDDLKQWYREFDEACTLTRTQRFIGFGICFIVGWIITLLALLTLPSILTSPERFALLYATGSIIALCSTAFLFGPCAQLKSMFKPVRAIATTIYILSIGLTIFCAVYVQSVLAVIGALIIQFLSMCWYCLSYIPYGRKMVTNCCKSCCQGLCDE